MPRLLIYAPKRDRFDGIRIAGFYWPDSPPTKVEVTEAEGDGPHEGGVRRVCKGTYARLVEAQQVGRLIIVPDGGEQAEIDKTIIAEQGRAIVDLKGALERALADHEAAGVTIRELRAQAEADAKTIDLARQEAFVQRRRADELASQLRELSKREPAPAPPADAPPQAEAPVKPPKQPKPA